MTKATSRKSVTDELSVRQRESEESIHKFTQAGKIFCYKERCT